MKLVTGGAGYIGSHFIKRYLETFPTERIVTVDNLSEGHAELLKFSDRIDFHKVDIGDRDAMKAIFKQYGVQTVIHFAASAYVEVSQKQPELYFQNNCIQTLHLLEAMEACGVREMVFSSTCASYGNPQTVPLEESHPQLPINVYGVTKLMTEQALRGYALSKNWSYVCLRYFNASGADESGLLGECHEPETHLIPLILQTAQKKRASIKVYGSDYDTADGTCVRDYIHVNDLADAHIKAIDYLQKHEGGEAFNLGTTTGSSVREVIDMCKQVTGLEILVEEAERRSGDPAILVANADKAEKLLGWKAQYTLQKIVETAWQWEQIGKPQALALLTH
jgi:UDP-glucose 4-epimerase